MAVTPKFLLNPTVFGCSCVVKHFWNLVTRLECIIHIVTKCSCQSGIKNTIWTILHLWFQLDVLGMHLLLVKCAIYYSLTIINLHWHQRLYDYLQQDKMGCEFIISCSWSWWSSAAKGTFVHVVSPFTCSGYDYRWWQQGTQHCRLPWSRRWPY